jgi:hypothetical protein
MHRRLGAAAVAVVFFAPTVAFAEADDIRDRSFHHIGKRHCTQYDKLHDWATRQFGKRTVGRDVCRFGMPKRGRDRVPTKAEFTDTMSVLRRWRHPPQPSVQAVSAAPSGEVSYGTTSGAYGGSGALPYCTWGPESGGDYNAVNPSSGAYGKYQVMPMHWNGGVCTGLGKDPAGQEVCAQRIYETSGAGAWVNC